jgi:hypothetical protein
VLANKIEKRSEIGRIQQWGAPFGGSGLTVPRDRGSVRKLALCRGWLKGKKRRRLRRATAAAFGAGRPVHHVNDQPPFSVEGGHAAVNVLRDPYTAKPCVLFYTSKRVGGGVQDFDAIKLLKFAAA